MCQSFIDNKYKMYYCSGKLLYGIGAVNPQINPQKVMLIKGTNAKGPWKWAQGIENRVYDVENRQSHREWWGKINKLVQCEKVTENNCKR